MPDMINRNPESSARQRCHSRYRYQCAPNMAPPQCRFSGRVTLAATEQQIAEQRRRTANMGERAAKTITL